MKTRTCMQGNIEEQSFSVSWCENGILKSDIIVQEEASRHLQEAVDIVNQVIHRGDVGATAGVQRS